MLAELEDVITATDAQTLVLEADDFRHSSPELLRRVAEWTEARGIRLVRWSRKGACTEVCGQPVLVDAVRQIVSRYPILRERLLGQKGEMRRDPERWRHLRPLLVAFVLAHGFAARSVIKTFGSIPPHPQPPPYDRHP